MHRVKSNRGAPHRKYLERIKGGQTSMSKAVVTNCSSSSSTGSKRKAPSRTGLNDLSQRERAIAEQCFDGYRNFIYTLDAFPSATTRGLWTLELYNEFGQQANFTPDGTHSGGLAYVFFDVIFFVLELANPSKAIVAQVRGIYSACPTKDLMPIHRWRTVVPWDVEAGLRLPVQPFKTITRVSIQLRYQGIWSMRVRRTYVPIAWICMLATSTQRSHSSYMGGQTM